jgi:hypothetical protein
MSKRMKYLILMIDGSCFEIQAETPYDAVSEVWKKYETSHDKFIEEVNMVEWKEDEIFHLKNYQSGFSEFNNESKLTRFLKIKELQQMEYEEFYGE